MRLIHYKYPNAKYMFKDHMKYFGLLFAIYTLLTVYLFNLKGDYIVTSSNCKNSICRVELAEIKQ